MTGNNNPPFSSLDLFKKIKIKDEEKIRFLEWHRETKSVEIIHKLKKLKNNNIYYSYVKEIFEFGHEKRRTSEAETYIKEYKRVIDISTILLCIYYQ